MLTRYAALLGALGIVSTALALTPAPAHAGSHFFIPTNTVINPTVDPTNVGDTVTFTTTVSSNYGTPDGDVIILQDGVQIDDLTLDGNGQATFDASFSLPGSSAFEADYQGSGLFLPSTGYYTESVNGTSPDVSGVPEPASAAGLGFGAFGIAALLLRRHTTANSHG